LTRISGYHLLYHDIKKILRIQSTTKMI